MENENQKEQRSRVRERIVPRKKYKRIIAVIASVAAVVALFGATLGIAISLSSRYMSSEEVKPIQTIIIARDEEPETTKVTRAESNKPQTVMQSQTETQSQTDGESTAEGSGTTEEPAEEETEAATLRTVYEAVTSGLVTVKYTSMTSSDYLGGQIIEETERFGVIIAEADDKYYVLTDGSVYDPASDTQITVEDVNAENIRVDSITNMMVFTIPNTSILKATAVPLGNSFMVSAMDDVFMFGSPLLYAGGVDSGIVTYVDGKKDILDGYKQSIVTNKFRENGGSAILVNSDGQIVGWVSDQTSSGAQTAVACGISALKYIIEDLCSDVGTAYLGIVGQTVDESQAEHFEIPKGLYVKEVVENSPAFYAGLQPGDCIRHMGTREVIDGRSLALAIDDGKPGEAVTIQVLRRGADGFETVELTATYTSR